MTTTNTRGKRMDAIERFRDALQTWDEAGGGITSREEHETRTALVAATEALVVTIPGIERCEFVEDSFGSLYFDAIASEEGDEISVGVRVSNHRRKPNSHMPPAWSFETGCDRRSVELGLRMISEEIENEK